MAIEIIPKKKPPTPPWLVLFFTLSILLLVCSLLSYFFILNQEKKYQQKIENIKNKISFEEKINEEKIKEIKKINDQISIFSKLIKTHPLPSSVFDNLATFTHPKVFYTSFDLNTERNFLSLSGQAENFLSLGQQILLFKENDLIEKAQISKISKTKEGKVEFSLDLFFKPELFQWKE